MESRNSDSGDEDDTNAMFRKYMRDLFPGTRNLEQQLDEMDAIDAVMDQEEKQTMLHALVDGANARKQNPSRKKKIRKQVKVEPSGKTQSDSSLESDVSDGDSFGEEEDSDDDEEGPVILNIIFALGSPNILEDSDDEDWEDVEETASGDSGDDDAGWEQGSHKYNTRSKDQCVQMVVNSGEQDASVADLVATQGRKTRHPSDKKTKEKDSHNHSGANGSDDMVQYFLENGEDAFKEYFAKKVSTRKEHVRKAMHVKKQAVEKANRRKNTSIFKKALSGKGATNNLKYFNQMSLEQQSDIIARIKEVNEDMHSTEPPKITILQADIPVKYKTHAMKKLNSLARMDPSSGEYFKVKHWVDGFMKIPFGKRSEMPVKMGVSEPSEISGFMESARNQLDGVTYGMEDAKSQIMQLVGQWVSNPSSKGTAIGIKGPMGTGKTTLIKHGVSAILERPFAFITLGGATDSSYLEGHSYTYEGSVWGQIASILMEAGTMNPVIYFDELDKVSDTAKGQEIIGILTHLTDTTQNTEFHDKYFAGVDFDLSGALFIFSYNDESLVNPILRDRMHVIETKGYNAKDKRTIARQFLIPEVEKTIGFGEGDITIEDGVIDHITSVYTKSEKGVRNLKRCLENIYAKLNVSRLAGAESSVLQTSDMVSFSTPFQVSREVVDKLLKPPTREVPATMYM
jgi:ATP-dependent Lon protease